MLNEGRKWVCEESYFFLENSPVKRYLQEIAGDTIIGGFTYKKILTDGVYCAALRQDGEKIYMQLDDDGVDERLLYDFGLKIGDMFGALEGEQLQLLVIDTIEVNDVRYKRMKFWKPERYAQSEGKIDTNGWNECWIEGIGSSHGPINFNGFLVLGPENRMQECWYDGHIILSYSDFKIPPTEGTETCFMQCATPTIAYAGGRLVFSCETPGAECVYEIKCADEGSGRGSEVSLSRTYEIRVHATLDGWQDSDVAVATIGWRDGRPVMEGFSSVTLDGDGSADVNGDGKVDVADIAKVIDSMAGQTRK